MRKDELFGGREQKSLNVLKSSVDYVLGEIKPILDESLKAESVVSDSLGVINNSDVNTTYSAFDNMNNFDVNSNNMDNSSFSQGQSESRAKVRVLTPNNSPAIKPIKKSILFILSAYRIYLKRESGSIFEFFHKTFNVSAVFL